MHIMFQAQLPLGSLPTPQFNFKGCLWALA